VQESFCKAANIVLVIVERRNELVVSGQVPFGVPLQMASKYEQSVAMSDVLRHVSQVNPFVAD
jgi:hypothetical protein